MTNSDRRTRRDILKTSGIALATATGAGCLNDASGTGSSGDEETGASTRTATATDTATATPKPSNSAERLIKHGEEFDWIPDGAALDQENALKISTYDEDFDEDYNKMLNFAYGHYPTLIMRNEEIRNTISGENLETLINAFPKTTGAGFVDAEYPLVGTGVRVGYNEMVAQDVFLANDELETRLSKNFNDFSIGERKTFRGDFEDEEQGIAYKDVIIGLRDNNIIGVVRRPNYNLISDLEEAYNVFEQTVDGDNNSIIENNQAHNQLFQAVASYFPDTKHGIGVTAEKREVEEEENELSAALNIGEAKEEGYKSIFRNLERSKGEYNPEKSNESQINSYEDWELFTDLN